MTVKGGAGATAKTLFACDSAVTEIHGYDFDQSLNYSGKHLYYMGSNLQIVASELSFFARNQILAEVQQGGSVTSGYDSTYLTGTQGSYDFIFLGDELTAYIGGLACATAVGDQINKRWVRRTESRIEQLREKVKDKETEGTEKGKEKGK